MDATCPPLPHPPTAAPAPVLPDDPRFDEARRAWNLAVDQLPAAAGMVPTPELEAPVRAQLDAVKAAMAPWAASRTYSNFADQPCSPATFWSERALHRLRRIKTAVDPHNLIRSNHPVPTATRTTP